MNIERLKVIAEWLEAGAPHRKGVDGFYMPSFEETTACGTTCCIAGAANQFFSPKKNSRKSEWQNGELIYRARRLLGLPNLDAELLFCPADCYGEDGFDDLSAFYAEVRHLDITAAWAARCIRKLIATGKVDWEGTKP